MKRIYGLKSLVGASALALLMSASIAGDASARGHVFVGFGVGLPGVYVGAPYPAAYAYPAPYPYAYYPPPPPPPYGVPPGYAYPAQPPVAYAAPQPMYAQPAYYGAPYGVVR